MTRRSATSAAASLLGAILVLAAAGCGGEGEGTGGGNGLSGRIQADGSSTVGPLTQFTAERFQHTNPGVNVTVGISGTGGGFERFCRGETDLSNASRTIKEEEAALCRENGVGYVELHVANDALTVVVNSENDWAKCLTVEQLRKTWGPGSKVRSWDDIDPEFPDQKLSLFGPGTDSGTFDYFTDVIVGDEGASRTDFQATENDNVIVQGVSGEKGGLGYFGFSYFDENRDKLKALAIDGGEGCVAPSVKAAQEGSYKPLSRPLFLYAKTESLAREEVAAFLDYLLDNELEIAEGSRFVPLTAQQLRRTRAAFERARTETA